MNDARNLSRRGLATVGLTFAGAPAVVQLSGLARLVNPLNKIAVRHSGARNSSGAAIAFARQGADVAINYLPGHRAGCGRGRGFDQVGSNAVALRDDPRNQGVCWRLVTDAVRALRNLCAAYRAGRKLCDRPDLQCGGRVWPALIT